MGELFKKTKGTVASGARQSEVLSGGNPHRWEIIAAFLCGIWCQRQDLNLRPRAYESPALPLSYSGGASQNAGEDLRRTKSSPFAFIVTSCLREKWLFLRRIRGRFRKVYSVRLLEGGIAAASSFIAPEAKGGLNRQISDGLPAVGDERE